MAGGLRRSCRYGYALASFQGNGSLCVRADGTGSACRAGAYRRVCGRNTRAVDAGANLSTHVGNGIAGLIPRHSNVLWPQLAEDRLTATMIADGHHVPADMFEVTSLSV